VACASNSEAYPLSAAEFHDKYDKDMYIDVADRARMESLTEKERELVSTFARLTWRQ
jgi:hypothetical protein